MSVSTRQTPRSLRRRRRRRRHHPVSIRRLHPIVSIHLARSENVRCSHRSRKERRADFASAHGSQVHGGGGGGGDGAGVGQNRMAGVG